MKQSGARHVDLAERYKKNRPAENSAGRFRSSTNLRERYGEGAHFLSIFNRFWRHVRQNRAFSQSVA
ncbi:MAG: hypothetical protein IJB25_11465, partial [Clostridia bacterium]|nr:hypothetical protein [Clostridia bacterium]